MTAEEWIDSNADKASTRFTDDGITLWEESEVCEMMQKYALHIAKQAVFYVSTNKKFQTRFEAGAQGETLIAVLNRIKKLTYD